ncbi:hypothetical protein MACK_001719 [Theileria orientalis]|uniref:Uncharacterized protein n=1 Tax=Theileria orientalis TaxID=68886 RepID=A0A976MDI4_THEOR|nr:hypothetical protein MACK_001719 [Theileria orientalis]
MEINRTHSHNSVLGINSIILEEDTSESCVPEETAKSLSDKVNFDSEVKFNDVANPMSNVKCVAIIEDVEKMFDMSDSKIISRKVGSTSMESSNGTSFSSVFNSIAPFSDMKKRYEGKDSTLSIDVNNKSIFTNVNDLNSEPSPINKFIGKEQISTDGDFYKDSKNETTLSSALLLDESQIKFIDEINKKKVPPPYEKVNAPRPNRFGAMPSCYVISKDDYFKSKNLSCLSQPDLNNPKIKKVPTSSQVNTDKISGFSAPANPTNSDNSNIGNSNYPGEGANNSSFFFNENNRANGRMRRNAITSGTHLIRGNSMVSVVNKGSSSMLILKIQSFTKNYLDINPDFGWRRLIDDKNLPFSNFSNNSYMFYIESKKSTHIISLVNLAINIACRAFILAVTHGYLDLDLTPEFLIKYLPVHISNSLSLRNVKNSSPKAKDASSSPTNGTTEVNKPILNPNGHLPKHCYYKGGVDILDEECGKDTMYLKSNFLGIYAVSSLVKNLRSENYRKRYERNKKLTRHKVEDSSSSCLGLDMLDKKNVIFTPNTYYNTKKNGSGFYKHIPIPEYGWKLLSKAPNDLRSDSKSEGFSKIFTKLFKKKPRFDTLYPGTLLCKVKPPHHYDSNCKVMVDSGSLAMNIAEQLYRLEISTNNREKFPKNTFGFSAHSDGQVLCPDGGVVDFVPEEVILNTASLLHEIYITQTYIIL